MHTVSSFGCTRTVQNFSAPKSGIYKLEVWGAQGGTHFAKGVRASGVSIFANFHGIGVGGYGGYSVGVYKLQKNEKLYVYVGCKGEDEKPYDVSTPNKGGWNGGGSSVNTYVKSAFHPSGGGSTDISLVYEEMQIDSSYRTFRSNLSYNSRIIVGGGGGAGCQQNQAVGLGRGGSGGGIQGSQGQYGYANANEGFGGTQTSPGSIITSYSCSFGSFGLGSGNGHIHDGASGGGGWWGGNENVDGGGGGSGFIGKVSSGYGIKKQMNCYNCKESTEENTFTLKSAEYSSNPIPFVPKEGDGYAIITIMNPYFCSHIKDPLVLKSSILIFLVIQPTTK